MENRGKLIVAIAASSLLVGGIFFAGRTIISSNRKPKSIRSVVSLETRGYTKEELAEYDGVKNQRILLSVKRRVYEVAPQFYGPGQSYHVYAGKEISRCLAKSQVSDEQANKYWVGNTTEEELKTLEQWADKFEAKYPVAGWFVPDESFFRVPS